MQNDIILNGVSIKDLVTLRDRIQPAAAAFISNKMAEAEKLIRRFRDIFDDGNMDSTPEEELLADLKIISENLEAVTLVSGISGIQYEVEWYDRRQSWIFDEVTYEDAVSDKVKDLCKNIYNVLEDMETTCAQWNASTC